MARGVEPSPRKRRTDEALRHPEERARTRRRRQRSALILLVFVVGCLVSVWALARAVVEGDLRAQPNLRP
jgi:ferric-dicitrate binding protein FerR (iron transport regulator)